MDGHHTHPSCAYPETQFTPAEIGARARARALADNPEARARGLQIIEAAARRDKFLSADTTRADFDAAGIPPKLNGGIWLAAEAHQIVTSVGERPSGGQSAHGKKIATYRSLVYLRASA